MSGLEIPPDATNEDLYRLYCESSGEDQVRVLLRLAKYPDRLPPDVRAVVRDAMHGLINEKAGPARRREADKQRQRELGLRRSARVGEVVVAEHRQRAAQVPTEKEAVGLSKAHRTRMPEVAIVYAERAIELAASSPLAWTALAASQRRAGKVDDALRSARHSVTLEPALSRNPYGYTALLATLVDLGAPDSALTDALEGRKGDGFAQNAAGRALRVLGHLARAESCFARAIELGQGEADAMNGLRDLLAEYELRGDTENARRLQHYLDDLVH